MSRFLSLMHRKSQKFVQRVLTMKGERGFRVGLRSDRRTSRTWRPRSRNRNYAHDKRQFIDIPWYLATCGSNKQRRTSTRMTAATQFSHFAASLVVYLVQSRPSSSSTVGDFVPPRMSTFHARCFVRKKRTTHTRRRVRTATPWTNTTNANEPAAEAILSGFDENGGYAVTANAPKLPNPHARRRLKRSCRLWRPLASLARNFESHSMARRILIAVSCWPLYAMRCNCSRIFSYILIHESIPTFIDIFHECIMCIVGNILSNIIEHCYMIILIKCETNLKIYVKIKIFIGGYIYMYVEITKVFKQ